jgi:hypothetical protein
MRASGEAGSWLVWVMPDKGSLPKSIMVCDPVRALASPWPAKYRIYALHEAGYTQDVG